MPRIKMPGTLCKEKKLTFEEAFQQFLTDRAANGVTDKTLYTYRNHLQSISHFMDITIPLSTLTRPMLNEMIVAMRKAKLKTNSISSYVQVVTTFLNWCKDQGYCFVDPP